MQQIHLWSLSPAAVEERFGALDSVLDADELRRADRLRRDEDRHAWMAAHTLLRHALTAMADIRRPDAWGFDRTPEGRPFVADDGDIPRLDFSLSHTRDWVACAVGVGARCGVDVERIRPLSDLEGLEERVLAPRERASLSGLRTEARLESFYRFWTLKESWGKATGVGILLPLEQLVFEVAHDDEVTLISTPEPNEASASASTMIQATDEAWSFTSRMIDAGGSSEGDDATDGMGQVVEALAVWTGDVAAPLSVTRHP